MKRSVFTLAFTLMTLSSLFTSGQARADIIIPGANHGSDGQLNCGTFQNPPNPAFTCDTPCTITPPLTYEIDLSKAENADWDAPHLNPNQRGKGVYDHNKWAVVFKYECVNIPSNVTVKFKNHPTHAPVVWLVSGDVKIVGRVDMVGGNGGSVSPRVFAEPGPGGFRGAFGNASNSSPGSAGFGPGGGWYFVNGLNCYSHASHGALGNTNGECPTSPPDVYGNQRAIPLIGGSGGSPLNGKGGAAGGGAILIATSRTITLSGHILAHGGNGSGGHHGSGGAIRLIADSVVDGANGPGSLQAHSYNTSPYSDGRIRIEANTIRLGANSYPRYTLDSPGVAAVLWPSDLGNAPSVRIASVGGQPANTDPSASLDFPGTDVTIGSGGAQLVVIDALNVPLDWTVKLRVIPKQGTDLLIPAAFGSGDASHSTWNATAPLGSGFSVLQARAFKPTAATASEAEEGVDAEDANGGQDEPTP